MWVRLKAVGWQPDTALEHISHPRLIALGLRGLLVVFAFVALVALATFAAQRLNRAVWWDKHWNRRNKRRFCGVAAGVGITGSLIWVAIWSGHDDLDRLIGAVALGLFGCMVSLALYVGWRAFKAWLIRMFIQRKFPQAGYSLEELQQLQQLLEQVASLNKLLRFIEGSGGAVLMALPLILPAWHYVNWQLAAIIVTVAAATGATYADPSSDAVVWCAAAIASLVMIAIAATGSWALFGITLALALSMTVVRLIVRSAKPQAWQRWLLIGGLALGAGAIEMDLTADEANAMGAKGRQVARRGRKPKGS
jgi:hypothetical protein